VLGLGPADFSVRVGGHETEVESVLWIPASADAAETGTALEEGELAARDLAKEPEGRLIVVLFQIDFAFHPSRTSGLLRMAPRAEQFINNLGESDRVAVFVFSSHLQLRADFTSDHAALSRMLTPTEILQGRMIPPEPSGPSLGDFFDPDEGRKAASMARALELIGESLQEIPGTKSLVFFGYALGRMSAGQRITIDDGYRLAMESLTDARTSVFSLDVTSADYHSLELGLREVAEDTGGFYIKTHLFPEVAMRKLTRVISSYYELELIPPPDLGEEYTIKVKVKRPRTDVYVRQDHPSPFIW
jgi:VWFA-related protein